MPDATSRLPASSAFSSRGVERVYDAPEQSTLFDRAPLRGTDVVHASHAHQPELGDVLAKARLEETLNSWIPPAGVPPELRTVAGFRAALQSAGDALNAFTHPEVIAAARIVAEHIERGEMARYVQKSQTPL
jgi:hypothetical protein